jgi:hypothetical protein
LTDVWVILGTLFAGVAACGWVWDKVRAHREAPAPHIEVEIIGEATTDAGTFDLVEVTNVGSDTAYVSGIIVQSATYYAMDGLRIPKILRPAEPVRLVYDIKDKPQAFVVLALRHHRSRYVSVTWEPLDRIGPMAEKLFAQAAALRTLPPRWVMGERRAQLVGPDGVAAYKVRLKSKESLFRIGVALGTEDPPALKPHSKPRRLLIWLWAIQPWTKTQTGQRILGI